MELACMLTLLTALWSLQSCVLRIRWRRIQRSSRMGLQHIRLARRFAANYTVDSVIPLKFVLFFCRAARFTECIPYPQKLSPQFLYLVSTLLGSSLISMTKKIVTDFSKYIGVFMRFVQLFLYALICPNFQQALHLCRRPKRPFPRHVGFGASQNRDVTRPVPYSSTVSAHTACEPRLSPTEPCSGPPLPSGPGPANRAAPGHGSEHSH